MPNPVPVLLCARSGVREKIPFCFQVTAADSLEGIWLCKGSALRCAPSSWYFGFQCRNPEIHGANECVPAPSSSSPSPRPLLRLQRVGEVRIREKARRRGVTCRVHFFLFNYALGCHEPRGGVSRGWLRAWAACWEGEKFTGLGDICCHPSEGLSPVGLIFKAVRSQDVSSALLGTGLLG